MGGSAPSPPSPMEEARAQILVEQEKMRMQEQLRQRLAQEALEKEQRDTAAFNENLASAKQGASNYARTKITGRGLNADDYMSQVMAEIENIARGVPIRDVNPAGYFGDDIADIVLNTARDNQRRTFKQGLDQTFAPGYDTNAWGDTSDDAILDSILGSQYSEALDTLTRQRDRGLLSGTGFDSALAKLNEQKTAGMSRLQDLGGGVLNRYRESLRGIGNEAYGRAGAYELGDTFDTGQYTGRFNDTLGEQRGRLEGDIRGALGGEQLFNIDDLITRAGIGQGLTNGGTRGVADAFAERENERERKRGLGEQGVF